MAEIHTGLIIGTREVQERDIGGWWTLCTVCGHRFIVQKKELVEGRFKICRCKSTVQGQKNRARPYIKESGEMNYWLTVPWFKHI